MFTRIYALAVCFVSIVCVAITSGIAIYDVVQITFPSFTVNEAYYPGEALNAYGYHPSQGQMQGRLHGQLEGHPQRPHQTNPDLVNGDSLDTISNVPLKKSTISADRNFLIQGQRQRLIENERRSAYQSLVQLLIVISVSLSLFIIHWRLAKRLEADTR